MAKSRNFSLFLLKTGFTAENSLKENHRMELLEELNTNIPIGGSMYVDKNPIKEPWWKEYWGVNKNLHQSSTGAIVFFPVDGRWFALSFGSSYHNLKDNAYEYDFGLKTTLNALDPEKIKSTDILQPESARRQRIQIPIASSLTYFDFNTDESIVKRLTGAVKNEFKDFFRNATGSCNLRFSTSYEAHEIVDLCSQLLKIYNREDYVNSFPNLHNIFPVKDPDIINRLNQKLFDEFNRATVNLTLAIPDIVDYSTNFKVKYRGSRFCSSEYDDIHIGEYRDFLISNKIEVEDCSIFHNHSIIIIDENGDTLKSFSIYKSFLFDCSDDDNRYYHLCEGEWYEINTDFIEKMREELNRLFIDKHDVLCECNQKREDKYNLDTHKAAAHNGLSIWCLDKENIAPEGLGQLEPCDLIIEREDCVEMIHNKISTRSSSLSHLFNQGINSVVLLQQQDESKRKLKKLIGPNASVESLIDGDHYSVTYGIITNKPSEMKSDCLPIFSRISLLRCAKSFLLMKIRCSVFIIKDNVVRKKQHEEE